MPITSHQIGSMIGGQQAMFGNFASYAQQISPGFQGSPPTYSNPMAGAGEGFAQNPLNDPTVMGKGAQHVSAIGNIALPALGTAAILGGSMLPGALGRAIGGFDPFTAGLRGFARGAGLSGGAGILSNMSGIASGGLGSIARAGLGGLGGAAAGMALPLAAGGALQFGVSQAVQGAQFQNQVQGVLDQNFRFQNPQAHSGYGFSREQGSNIADMVRTMGHSDMMTGPQELLRVMKSGAQQGLFRTVQDVKEFKKKFTDMVGALKEVAQTMNTTLEGAMPFFSQARQMGFWTPNDIARNAQQVRQTAATSGLSVAQTQQMMGQGAQMARSVGAAGASGAQGMQQSLELVGGGLRGGFVSEQALSEATGGLTGGEAVQSMAATFQAGATRFARSSRARWMMAAMGRNGFTSLDPGKMRDLTSGNMGLGDIQKLASRNINEQGAFNFVNNEEQLRGELLKQGPAAQFGFMRAMAGGALYGDDPRSKLITRRMMKRNFGYDTQAADLAASFARNSAQIMRESLARGASGLDQQERDQEQLMNKSWDGLVRKASTWLDKTVKDPIQKFGAELSKSIDTFYEEAGDRLWGRASASNRFRGIDATGIGALKKYAMGDTNAIEKIYGKSGDLQKQFGSLGTMGDLGAGGSNIFSGGSLGDAFSGGGGGLMNVLRLAVGHGGQVSTDKMDVMLRMGARERKFATAKEREAAIREGGLYAGRYQGHYGSAKAESFNAFLKQDVDRIRAGMAAGISGKVTGKEQASALDFGGEAEANKAIKAAQGVVESDSYREAIMKLKDLEGASEIEVAKAQIKAIESNTKGLGGLKKYIAGGKTMSAKINRLAAANTGARGMRGALDLSDEAKKADIGTFTGLSDLENKIDARLKSTAGELSKAMGGQSLDEYAMSNVVTGMDVGKGPIPTGVGSPEAVNKIVRKGDPEFKEAMILLSAGGSEEEQEANRLEARKKLLKLAGDSDTYTKDEAKTLMAMVDKSSPNYANIKKQTEMMGKLYSAQKGGEFAQTTMRRAVRLYKNMGEERGRIMGNLNKIKGKGGRSIGQIMRELQASTNDPKAYIDKMKELVTVASQADEKQVAQAAELVGDFAGGESVSTLLYGGREIQETMKTLTNKRKLKKAAGKMTDVIGSDLLGDQTISGEDMKGIQAGDEETIKRIVGGVTGKENKERVKEILKGVGGKAGEEGLRKILTEQYTAQGVDLLGAGKDAGEKIQRIGRLGSSAGIHQTLTDQLRIMDQLLTVTKERAGIKDQPQAPREVVK
jgi:hypothetical protein